MKNHRERREMDGSECASEKGNRSLGQNGSALCRGLPSLLYFFATCEYCMHRDESELKMRGGYGLLELHDEHGGLGMNGSCRRVRYSMQSHA